MKTKCYTTYRIFLIALILYVFTFGTGLTVFAKPLQVAIVPFKVNAEKDLSFLKDGIVDMLSSRLFWEDKVSVINRQATEKASAAVGGPLNESIARKLGAGLGADYVLFGSLTVFGNSVSIDAKMVDVSGKKQTLTFFNQSQGMDQVIPNINLFASDINEKVFGRVMETRRSAQATGLSSAKTAQAQTDVRAHPEKLLSSGGYGGSETSVQQNTLNPAFITTSGVPKGTREFWKSHNFEFLINGLAIGDVDGDGKIETVIARPQSVNIYRMENNRFYKVVELPEISTRSIIGVDVADINGNGIPEIFVTCLNALQNGVSSFVLEYNGQNYNEIVRNSHYYYRVVAHPERRSILFGQRQLSGSDPFSSAIFEMTWDGSDYEPGNQILPPGRANLMGFAYGNVFNDGQDLAVAYDSNDHIRIFNAAGKEEWKGDQPYGGSMLHLVMPLSSPGDPGDLFYLPMHIYVRDIDANGKNEVIAVNNSDVAGRYLGRFRHFSHFQIEALSWNGLGLVTDWKTQESSGSVRDFAVGDFDNDGQDELIAAVIIKEGTLVGSAKQSAVIAYDLNR